jgi:ribonuclease Z
MLSGISFMDIDKIFITHWHADHFAGLIGLIQTMNLEKRTKELKIFGPEAERFVSDIVDLGYFGLRFPVSAINIPFEGEEVTKADDAEEYEVHSIPVLHTVPAVAYCFKEKDRWSIDVQKLRQLGLKRGRWLKVLKKKGRAEVKGREVLLQDVAKVKRGLKVVYTGDTKPCSNLIKISEGSDLLIHDSTFLEEEEGKAHADVKQAAELAKTVGAKQLILTHISRRYKDASILEKRAKKTFPNTKVAHDFMKVKLK